MLGPDDAQSVADAFGLGGGAVLSGPVARGEVGQVWRLDTGVGRWAVKEPFAPPDPLEAADDADYQDVLRRHGVPMPALVRSLEGHPVAVVRDCAVRIYEFVDLSPPDPWMDPEPVGRAVASIHRVRHVGRNGLHPWYTDPVGAEVWDDLVARCVDRCAPFADALAAHRDAVIAAEAVLERPSALQTCHCDLFADNVLRTPSGALCVIDWENSGLAGADQELAVVLFEFSCGDDDRARALYDAYVAGGGPGRLRRRGDFSMLIAQIGHLGERACRRWLDETLPAMEHARSEASAQEFLARPVTVELCDALLDAIHS